MYLEISDIERWGQGSLDHLMHTLKVEQSKGSSPPLVELHDVLYSATERQRQAHSQTDLAS